MPSGPLPRFSVPLLLGPQDPAARDRTLVRIDGKTLIRFPKGLLPYRRFERQEGDPDLDPGTILDLFYEAGWLVADDPMLKTVTIGRVAGLWLRDDIAQQPVVDPQAAPGPVGPPGVAEGNAVTELAAGYADWVLTECPAAVGTGGRQVPLSTITSLPPGKPSPPAP